MKRKRKYLFDILSIGFALFGIMLGALDVQAAQSVNLTSSITWKYDESSRTLTINGKGAMPGYENKQDIPWYRYLNNIEKVIISDGITEIGKGNFYECTYLKSVQMPETVIVIQEYAFSGCSSLENVTFPLKLKVIGDAAFHSCTRLSRVEIPSSVENMGMGVFASCKGLIQAEVLAPLSVLPDYTFNQCNALQNVILPNTLTSIGNAVFDGCISLITVEIPENVKSLGESLFGGCQNLRYVSLPKGVTAMSVGVFAGCSNLESIMIPESIGYIPSLCFYGCSSLSEVDLPDSIVTVGDYAYAKCSSLKKIWISKSVLSIGKNVFMNTDAVVIYGYRDSEAGRYAEEENIRFLAYDDETNYYLSIDGDCIYSGRAQEPVVKVTFNGVRLKDSVDYEVIYENNRDAGTANVFVKGKNRFVVDLACHFSILPAYIENTKVILSQETFIYDNSEKRPSVCVVADGNVLIEGKDYLLEYRDARNAGTASVIVKGTGNYQGSNTTNFTIEKAEQEIIAGPIKKSLGSSAFYLGAQTNGNGKLTYESGSPSVATISLSGKVNIKSIGRTEITIHASGTENYTGAVKKVTITVVPQKMGLISAKSVSPKEITVKWKKREGMTGYQLCCSSTMNFSKDVKCITLSNKKTEAIVKGLKSKKIYYVRVRAFKIVDGTKYYGAWSTLKSNRIR